MSDREAKGGRVSGAVLVGSVGDGGRRAGVGRPEWRKIRLDFQMTIKLNSKF